MTIPGGTSLPPYTGGKTSGILVRASGEITMLVSGVDGPSKDTRGVPGMHNRIKTHVEAHAAVIMRRERLAQATLLINRQPCPTADPRSPGCLENLPRMLPEGGRLRVVGPDNFDRIFTGLPDPPGCAIVGISPEDAPRPGGGAP